MPTAWEQAVTMHALWLAFPFLKICEDWRERIAVCQFASKRDPLFASNRDPLCGDGSGLIHVVHRRDPRAPRSAPTSDVATRVGGACAPTWVSPGGGPGEGFVSCGF